MEMAYKDGETPLDPDEMDGLKQRHIETRGELNQLEHTATLSLYVLSCCR